MARSFYQEMDMPDGKRVAVHVNRRGCKERWSKESAHALQAIVEALHKMTPEQIAEARTHASGSVATTEEQTLAKAQFPGPISPTGER